MRIRSDTLRLKPISVPGTLLLSFCIAISPLLFGGVEALAEPRCEPTRADIEGPFYKPGAPERTSTGEALVVSGRLLGAPDCRPLPGGRIEWWHADPSGNYDDAHRGSLKANADGTYRYSTDVPGKYPGRPLHIHVKAFADGYKPLTTQLYLRGGEKQVVYDIVLAPLK
jgi:protocatechuate 3,4-dioxygenase beta subunit